MAIIYKTTFKLRRGKSSEWKSKNPTLADGEPGFSIDTNELKIGDGVKAWNDLPYIVNSFVIIDTYSNLPHPSNSKDLIYVCEDSRKAYVHNSDKTEWLCVSGSGSGGGSIIGIKANGTLLNIVEGIVDIPQASGIKYGLVKGSDGINKIKICDDGTMELNSLGVDKLRNVDGVELILKSKTEV